MGHGRAIYGTGVAVLATIAALAVPTWNGGERATGSAGVYDQIAAFAPSASADLPTSADRAAFLARVPSDEPTFPTLDLSRLRTFHSAPDQNYTVSAAPTTDGKLCYFDSFYGGECFSSFLKGGGLAFTFGPAVNLDHVVATGLVPDGATQITFHTTQGDFTSPIKGNVFRFDLPASVPDSAIHSYTLQLSSGQQINAPLD